ncbi:related to multidrug resistance protein [Phialocephala subalpina]|uniref:Related to multidrug resistance protein n=1 Tax=Phialocephala subalpina TaxID=576137 RepID=A0A1L7WIZ0_9HELO|nr:related to multidrug resistance protein [Phialocephala subalpina]
MSLYEDGAGTTTSHQGRIFSSSFPQKVVSWDPTDIVFTATIISAIVFLIYLPFRLQQLRKCSIEAVSSWQGPLKSMLAILLSIISLIYLINYLTSPTQNETPLVASILISIFADLGLGLLLFLSQRRSLRPSDLATLYLISSILCDVILLTIPSGLPPYSSHLIALRCMFHFALLILECRNRLLVDGATNKSQSPEETSGVLSRVFFSWINPILIQGYKNILIDQDLPPLSQELRPKATRRGILQAWDQRAKPESRRTLPLTLFKCIRKPFIAAIIPRLFLIVFRYSQPVLIKESIRFVLTSSAGSGSNRGYWLIVSAIAVYVGLAISTGIYQQRLNKLKLLTRSALVGLIHDKTMNSPSISYDNGESTTLMSTDADSLDGMAEMFHETWAQVFEVVIGIVLLASEVGWIWPLLLFLIFLCSRVSRYVAKNLQPRQKAWNSATQARVAATSSMLSSMKTIKMLGFQSYLAIRIQELREQELYAASKLRWMQVYYNASANALGIISPAVTLVIYAVIAGIRGRSLDTETAFTTMAILSMVTHPANMVMTIVPKAIGAMAGFERIQTFLLRPALHDFRGLFPKTVPSDETDDQSLAIEIRDLRIGEKKPVLENVNLEMLGGSLTIISGPVGSGKSTLLRSVLGEVSPAAGCIKVSTKKIAYCSQRPWLPSGSAKKVILGMTEPGDDERWYKEVVEVCCLSHDFEALRDGEETEIGSRGMNLSGGQRQRVALARALFARCEIVLLDDCFSGLDGETEHNIFESLFGSTGLFKRLRTTVVLVANSTQYFQAADQIVILGDGGVKEQGTWQELKTKSSTIMKFVPRTKEGSASALVAGFDRLSAQMRARDEAEVDLSRQTGDLALYGYYVGFAGLANILLVNGFTVAYSFFITIPQYWLQLWTQSNGSSPIFWILGFLSLSVMSWALTSLQVWIQTTSTAARYRDKRTDIVLLQDRQRLNPKQARTSLTLACPKLTATRFSQDIQLIDKNLPTTFSNVGVQVFKLFMQAVLLFIAQKYLAMSLPACMLLVYLVQKIYLRTSRQLRFLELESRAEVFSSFLESIEGLETIRAFTWRRQTIDENILRVSNSQRPDFLLLSLQRWLNIVLDLLAAALASSVVAIAVIFRGRISGGQVGVGLNIMLVANTTLLKLVENWTTLEISLGAVARLKGLEKETSSEGTGREDFEPDMSWPSKGGVEIKDITASYHADSVALRNLSLNIEAGQRVIVCGRTGSGKSSLLLTLLRILEVQSGKIEVDGVDISRVRLGFLRQRCFITVSQDALLLSNETLRFNLDPEVSLSDDILIDGLARCGLWKHFLASDTEVNVPDFAQHPILDTKISLFSELSVGQCQLFALCRGIIKANAMRVGGVKSIVLLDEVTSSLDHATESTIHGIIDEEFTGKGHTVIIVAHRLSVLSEYMRPGRDIVAMLGDGKLVEVIRDLRGDTLKTLGEKR